MENEPREVMSLPVKNVRVFTEVMRITALKDFCPDVDWDKKSLKELEENYPMNRAFPVVKRFLTNKYYKSDDSFKFDDNEYMELANLLRDELFRNSLEKLSKKGFIDVLFDVNTNDFCFKPTKEFENLMEDTGI